MVISHPEKLRTGTKSDGHGHRENKLGHVGKPHFARLAAG
jgi:hypothetical protein